MMNSTRPILSILIATYNRSFFLERLLSNLSDQIHTLSRQPYIEILISDNASEDNTNNILSHFCSINRSFSFTRHSTNIGAEANIMSLLEKAKAPYCWIIGDDDMPVTGLLRHIITLLSNESPSLIYLRSLWNADISTLHPEPISILKSRNICNYEFAKEFHVWTTFLSSWIFNADQLFDGLSSKEQVSTGLGTSLPQLGWILPLLNCPQSKILVIDNICILATSGNTGGYSIINTFLLNYPRLVCLYTAHAPRVRHALISNALKSYIPRLILSVRAGSNFRDVGSSSGILLKSIKILWRYPKYWLLSVPALLLPKIILIYLRSLIKIVTILSIH